MEHLDQPLFLLGYGVQNLVDGIRGDEGFLYGVELSTRDSFEESSEQTVEVSDHFAFLGWDGPTEEAFEWGSWQFLGSIADALANLVTG